uniref:Clathrin light chain n=1 Tax=Echinostoma caproni TaxID=27848 RepID=A0A183B2U1_9TREM
LQQALDAYERELRREAKRRLELSASGVSATSNDPEFWLGVAKRQTGSDRWGHDGWEELQRPGPPAISESFLSYSSESKNKDVSVKTSVPKLPVARVTAPPSAPSPPLPSPPPSIITTKSSDKTVPKKTETVPISVRSPVSDHGKSQKRSKKEKKKSQKDKRTKLSGEVTVTW